MPTDVEPETDPPDVIHIDPERVRDNPLKTLVTDEIKTRSLRVSKAR